MIFTRHKECGNCNSVELHKIIEKISPEIIFEELLHATYDEVYKEKSLNTLESNAIKKYLQNHNIEHIPVDTYPLPKNYYEDLERMYQRIFTSNIIYESRALQNLVDYQTAIINQKGFDFLNSDENDKYFEEFSLLKDKILNVINNENLFSIQQLEKEINERREYEIIKNIYNFSKDNPYKIAIMFIGSGHRKSIFEVIKKVGNQKKVKLNWKTFNDLPST